MQKNISNVCIVDSVYTLFLYSLIIDDDQLEKTYYFVSSGIAESIIKNLKQVTYVPNVKGFKSGKLYRFVTLRLLSGIRFPFLKKAKIWRHDHIPLSWFLIGNRRYTCIEDGPIIWSTYVNCGKYESDKLFWEKSHSLKDFILKAVLSPVYRAEIGSNSLCEEMIVTTDDYHDFREGKKITKINPSALWKNASDVKKNYIKYLYSLSQADIDAAKAKKTVLITQPFSSDGVITEVEQIAIYRKMLEGTNIADVLIKPHPRDKIDYGKYFPSAMVFEKPLPFQLLSIIGIKFNRAITVCSSTITSFDYKLDIEISGTTVHPKLVETYGILNEKDLIKK